MAKKVTLTPIQLKAIVDGLNEGITSCAIADDAYEVIWANLDDGMKPVAVRKWCENWDIAIQFHNDHCAKKQKYSKPWMVATLEEVLEDRVIVHG